MALARQETGAVSAKRMTIEELHSELEFIRGIMKSEMKEGVDYGKVPGCGDKPGLFQPGAQKLMMVFRLSCRVKKEEVKDIPHPNIAGHREYAFTITAVSATGREWDGVGTCSTMESKYRYRSMGRKCPSCGRSTILKSKKGKPEWFCWKKKGGCGATFALDAAAIMNQPEGKIEHDNPADNWNTVRKIAFKRALVYANINATNSSELWSQDLEDLAKAANEEAEFEDPGHEEPPPPRQEAPPPARRAPQAAPASNPAPVPFPTAESRSRMIKELKAGLDGENRLIVTEYFQKLRDPTPLAPFEHIEDLKLIFVPGSVGQMKALAAKIRDFENGLDPTFAFPPHPEPNDKPKPKAAADPAPRQETAKDPEWWRDVIIPVPHKGQKRDDYMKHPDTIGGLFEKRHEDEQARNRLFGFAYNWQPEPRTFRGKTYEPTAADLRCRDALDAFVDWYKANHPEEQRNDQGS